MATAKASGTDTANLKSQLAAKEWSLSDPAISLMQEYAADPTKSKAYDNAADNLVAALGRCWIVQEPAQPVRRGVPRTAILRSGEPGQAQDIEEVVIDKLVYVKDSNTLASIAKDIASKTFADEPLRPAVADLVVRTLQGPPGKEPPAFAPLWRYDPAATLEGIKQAQDRVTVAMVHREPGDLLVRAGTVLTGTEIELLQREHEAYEQASRTDSHLRRQRLLQELGTATMVLILTIGIAAYSTVYQRLLVQRPDSARYHYMMASALNGDTKSNPQRAAEHYRLPFAYVKAVAKVESNFDPMGAGMST